MTEQIDHPVADWPTLVTAPAPVPVPTYVPLVPAADPVPAPAAPVSAAPTTETVTCPECGTIATVAVRRRDSTDFCRTCDYPLFWLPSRIQLDSADQTDSASLRRLPGTVGRLTVASLACPHCSEPNAVSAQVCVRCGEPMRPVAPPPPPEIVYVPAPAPEPVIVQAPARIPWWVWALLFVVLSGSVALLTVLMLNELT